MGWTEQIGLQGLVGLVCIGQIVFAQILESADMVVSVVAYAVTAFHNHTEHIGVFAHIVAHHEEGGFYLKMIKNIQHKRRGFGNGSVIEGQINDLLMTVHSP